MRSRGLSLVFLCVLFSSCQTVAPPLRTRGDDEGAVYLYLEPLPREAERLRAVIGGVSVVDAEGHEIAMAVSLRELRSPDAMRQRLLAAGPLPAGEYSGFLLRTTKASLRGEQGESALLLSEAPARIDVRFRVHRREALVVSARLRYPESVEAGFRFAPVFSALLPAIPPIGLMGFTANAASNDVTAFDKRAMRVFGVIATGRGPSGMAIDTRSRRLYVALAGEDAVEVVDVLAAKVADRIQLTPGDRPAALALTPDGATLLCANQGSNTVSLIDAPSRVERTRIDVGNGPRAIVLDRTGRRAFVFNALSNTISVLDVAGRNAIRAIGVDAGPWYGNFSRANDRLYVIHENLTRVTVINPATLTVTGTLPIRSAMDTIKVDPGTDLVYLGGSREFVVGVYEPMSFVPVDFVDSRGAVNHMTTDADQNALYLVSAARDRVFVFDRIRKRALGELDVGQRPAWISVMGEN